MVLQSSGFQAEGVTGPVRGVQLVLEKASRITVVHQLERGTAVRVVDANGLPVWFTRVLDQAPLRTRLQPGEYVLDAYRNHGLVLSEPFAVTSEPVVLELDS